MYLGSFAIDDTCTFTCNTHTPSTGAAVDADAVPSYRVYEDETATPILTGNMALLDDSNTTGYYSEQITLSAANGFEYGKSYTIRIAAVVGGVTGITERHFSMGAKVNTTHVGGTLQTAGDLSALLAAIDDYIDTEIAAIKAKTDLITATGIVIVSTPYVGGHIELRKYNTISIPIPCTSDLTGRTKLWFTVKDDPNSDADTAAQVLIEETAGLTRLEGAAYTTIAHGTITVSALTTVTVGIHVTATSLLVRKARHAEWSLKWKNASGTVTTLATGTAEVVVDPVAAVS